MLWGSGRTQLLISLNCSGVYYKGAIASAKRTRVSWIPAPKAKNASSDGHFYEVLKQEQQWQQHQHEQQQEEQQQQQKQQEPPQEQQQE
jgi:hypothetical protein